MQWIIAVVIHIFTFSVAHLHLKIFWWGVVSQTLTQSPKKLNGGSHLSLLIRCLFIFVRAILLEDVLYFFLNTNFMFFLCIFLNCFVKFIRVRFVRLFEKFSSRYQFFKYRSFVDTQLVLFIFSVLYRALTSDNFFDVWIMKTKHFYAWRILNR